MIATTQNEQVIENWMLSIVQDGGVDRYDDLHINQIDTLWADKMYWVEGALEAYRLAVSLRDRHLIGLTVAVAFSFKSTNTRMGFNMRTSDELRTQLDWSPPSLYLFNPAATPWRNDTDSGTTNIVSFSCEKLDCSLLFGSSLPVKECVYLEFLQLDSADYSRSLFVSA